MEPGSKPTVPYSGGHVRRNIIGAVRPSDGAFSTFVLGHCNTDVFQVFLDTLAREHPHKEGIRQLLIMDNASWHKTKSLSRHRFEAQYLPPYSPYFNPIERFWLRIKNDFFSPTSSAGKGRSLKSGSSLQHGFPHRAVYRKTSENHSSVG